MKDDLIRFIVISVPPEPLLSELNEQRLTISELSGSAQALSYPPHVTLRTGAMVPREEVPTFIAGFVDHCTRLLPFAIQLRGLDFLKFPEGTMQGAGSYFAGYSIAEGERIVAAHRDLLSFASYRKGPQSDFHPHLTLAFDDLDEAGFARIRDWFLQHPENDLSGRSWECDRVSLYTFNGQNWQEFVSAALNGAA